MSDVVIAARRGPALWLTINRPERRNAFDDAVLSGLTAGLDAVRTDAGIRAVVLTGAGDRAFCAGADLRPGAAFDLDPARTTLPFADLVRAVRATPVPVVARVNGACLAGGLGLLAACDMAVAAEDALFGAPEPKVGIFPTQVFAVLQGLVPRRMLHEWCLTGEPFDAAEAQRAGLVNHVVPRAELDARTEWLLGRLVDKSPVSLRRGKHMMRAAEAMSPDEALAYAEAQLGTLILTEDAREGRAAFNEKRKPAWTGR